MYVYINHQEHGQAYMNIWVVKSIVKPNTNPTPCTKGMEDSPLDSGQTLISDQTLIGSLYHAHTSRVNNFFMSYMYRQLRWSWYMDKLPNQQVNYFHEKLPRVFALGQNLVRSSVFWYPGENAREIWLLAILREMRIRRVCVTAQSKSSYCMVAGQKVSLRCCKNQAVGRNLSLPYIPLSLPATLLQNTVCVFQNSIWPLTIPVSEYPSAELSFSLKVGK